MPDPQRSSEYIKTVLKVFSLENINTPLAEKTFSDGYCHYTDNKIMCILPDGSILFKIISYISNQTELLKLCPYTLNTLSSQPWKEGQLACYIDNNHFFHIRSDYYRYESNHFLITYKWNGNT